MITFDNLKIELLKYNSFIITSHVNPDPDAIGSEIAMYYALKRNHKNVRIINHNETPYNMVFLDKENIIEKYDSQLHDKLIESTEAIILLDLNQLSRVVSMVEIISKSNATKFVIDHHQNPGDFPNFLYIDENSSATGEILFDFFDTTNFVNIDIDIAIPLYAAIMTDTGSFRYERTTPKTHIIAARLLETGLDPKMTFELLYEQNNFERFKLLGKAFDSISLTPNKKVSYIIITQKDLTDTKATETDVDGFVNYCLSIKGVLIGLLFYQLQDGFKVSFRSRGNIPINELAKEFNGGGHFYAAGTRLFETNFEEYIEKILHRAQIYSEKY